MQSLIDELYYRNLKFKNDSKEHHRRMANLSEILERNQKDLMECLTDKGKEIFEKYKDCSDELSTYDEHSQYVNGFLIGGRLVAEILLLTAGAELQD